MISEATFETVPQSGSTETIVVTKTMGDVADDMQGTITVVRKVITTTQMELEQPEQTLSVTESLRAPSETRETSEMTFALQPEESSEITIGLVRRDSDVEVTFEQSVVTETKVRIVLAQGHPE